MSTSAVVHRISADAVPSTDIKAWRQDLFDAIRGGARIVTLYGRRCGDDVNVRAVLQMAQGGLRLSGTSVAAQDGYHELSSEVPALHCFERELHEQTGVRIAAHPWLKPIRYEGRDQRAMDDYPFYKIDGKEVHEVAVGPIHAGVIEPGSFRFACLGEQVHHLEVQLGYQHRGVERRLLKGDPRRLAPLVETIAGDTSIAHTWAYCAAIESLAGCDLGLDVDVGRAVALELERVAMHLASLAGMAGDIGFLQGATTYGRLRTTAINATMRLCGSRFGRTALVPGGVRMRLSPESVRVVADSVALLRRDLPVIHDCFMSARTVAHRLQGVGTVTEPQANMLGAVGVVGRASGVALDLRQPAEWGAYKLAPIASSVCSEGDCWARARIRIMELDASLAWLAAISDGHLASTAPVGTIGAFAPRQIVVALVEGWRGEVVHCLETDDVGGLAHYKVQDPSLRNWMVLAQALRGNEISDFPICNKSFDLSYCGHDL